MGNTSARIANHNIEDDMITLGFAARLLLVNLDRELIIERAFESMADFGASDRIGMFVFDQEGFLACVGGLIDNGKEKRSFRIDELASPWEQIFVTKNHAYLPLAYQEGIPVPVSSDGIEGGKCLCAPLVAANNQVVGIVTFAYASDFSMPPLMMQSLILLLTIVAVALETARLFQQAIYDGLTGLYIRRYFDLRLTEEENRIRRYGGRMAILMADIDHFKRINDTYGHQLGDQVLREVADIIKLSIRKDLDSPCRYGGEEFVVIMPDTDPAGALAVSERIRKNIQDHVFHAQSGPFHITLSGGIAYMDQPMAITGADLLKRADGALYQAKENGRNQMRVWQEEPVTPR